MMFCKLLNFFQRQKYNAKLLENAEIFALFASVLLFVCLFFPSNVQVDAFSNLFRADFLQKRLTIISFTENQENMLSFSVFSFKRGFQRMS